MKFIIVLIFTVFSSLVNANPVGEAKAKEWLQKSYPMVTMTMACNNEYRFEFLQFVMNRAYAHAATMPPEIVDMWWMLVEMEEGNMSRDTRMAVYAVKRNPNSKLGKEGCNFVAEFLNELKSDGLL